MKFWYPALHNSDPGVCRRSFQHACIGYFCVCVRSDCWKRKVPCSIESCGCLDPTALSTRFWYLSHPHKGVMFALVGCRELFSGVFADQSRLSYWWESPAVLPVLSSASGDTGVCKLPPHRTGSPECHSRLCSHGRRADGRRLSFSSQCGSVIVVLCSWSSSSLVSSQRGCLRATLNFYRRN